MPILFNTPSTKSDSERKWMLRRLIKKIRYIHTFQGKFSNIHAYMFQPFPCRSYKVSTLLCRVDGCGCDHMINTAIVSIHTQCEQWYCSCNPLTVDRESWCQAVCDTALLSLLYYTTATTTDKHELLIITALCVFVCICVIQYRKSGSFWCWNIFIWPASILKSKVQKILTMSTQFSL